MYFGNKNRVQLRKSNWSDLDQRVNFPYFLSCKNYLVLNNKWNYDFCEMN